MRCVTSVNGICANLYSIIQGLKCGNEFHFTPEGSYCQLKGRMVKIPIKVKNDPPRLVMDMKISKEPIARSAEAVAKSMAANALIHRRCAHVSHKNLSHLVKQGLVQGLRYDAALTPDCLCRVCTVATSARSPFDTDGVRREHSTVELDFTAISKVECGMLLSMVVVATAFLR